jgi:transposase InsO family protein
MVRELRLLGFTAGKERIERLMRENGIYARHKRGTATTTALVLKGKISHVFIQMPF